MNAIAQLIDLLLSDISEVDIEIIMQLAEIIPTTQLSYYSEIFNFILQYYEINKEIPSADFLQQNFKIWTRTTEKVSKEAINILMYELKKDSAINKTMLALQERDTDKARALLDSEMTKAEFTETKVSDICFRYDEMNQMPEGIQIGVPELDNIYKNFSYGTNNIIAAPQKSGKTTAALSITYDALMRRGMNVVYLTLEVKPTDIYANLFARHAYEMGTSLNAQKVKKNLLDSEERKVLGEMQSSFEECLETFGGNLSVVSNDDFPEFNIAYLKQFLATKQEEWGSVDMVVIDHIGLTGFYKMKGVSDMKERINIWIKATTDLAKGFNDRKGFILITLMQVNRQGTNLMRRGQVPGFDVLADANEAERSAHTITVMYSNPDMLLAKSVRLYCLANRNGPPLSSDKEDNSIETYLNPEVYLLGHRKYTDSINLKNKDLLKKTSEPEAQVEANDLFSSMI